MAKTGVKTKYPKSRIAGLRKGGPIPSRSAIYGKLAVHSDTAIKRLIELLDSKNENIRLGAIHKVLDKVIPDVRSLEVGGVEGKPLGVVILPALKDVTNNQLEIPSGTAD